MNTLAEVFQSIHAERQKRAEGRDNSPLHVVARNRPTDCYSTGVCSPSADFHYLELRWNGHRFTVWYRLLTNQLSVGGVFIDGDEAEQFWQLPSVQEELFRMMYDEE